MSSCLDIPVPRCVRHLLREPPVCTPKHEDAKVLDLIRNFGLHLKCPEDEIKQACYLASGSSDMVVILERPRIPSDNHNYSAGFDGFVESCPTLYAVDELIRYGSKGTRSIHTVTVLDGFIFKPNEDQKNPTDDDCHDLLEKILKLKRPQVIICCWQSNGRCFNPYVCQFMSLGVGKEPVLKQKTLDHSPGAWAVQSFHPSYAINHHTEQKAYARTLLICHFVFAFRALAGLTEVPNWVAPLCRGSSRERDRVSEKLTTQLKGHTKHLVRTAYILKTLDRIVKNNSLAIIIQHSENRIAQQQRQEVNHLLSQLFSVEYNDGTLEISRLCLLWKSHEHPAAERVMNKLISIGSNQQRVQSAELSDYSEHVLVADSYQPLKPKDKGVQDHLAAKLGSVRLQDFGLLESSTDEENAVLAKLMDTLTEHTKQLRRAAPVAAQLTRAVYQAIELQATENSPHNAMLAMSIAGFAKDQYSMLEDIAAVVNGAWIVLCGDTGLIANEEQPYRAIIHRPDTEEILDKISAEAEVMVRLTITFVLQFTGLVAQGRILFLASGLDNDDIVKTFKNYPWEFAEYVQNLSRELDAILSLRDQQLHAEPLMKVEHAVPVLPPTDRGLREVYKMALRKAPLAKGANTFYVPSGAKSESPYL